MQTVVYTGDKSYMMFNVRDYGRLCFNKHNDFKIPVPLPVAEQVMKMYGRFFRVESLVIETKEPDSVKTGKREMLLNNLAKGRAKLKQLKEQGVVIPRKKRVKKK